MWPFDTYHYLFDTYHLLHCPKECNPARNTAQLCTSEQHLPAPHQRAAHHYLLALGSSLFKISWSKPPCTRLIPFMKIVNDEIVFIVHRSPRTAPDVPLFRNDSIRHVRHSPDCWFVWIYAKYFIIWLGRWWNWDFIESSVSSCLFGDAILYIIYSDQSVVPFSIFSFVLSTLFHGSDAHLINQR